MTLDEFLRHLDAGNLSMSPEALAATLTQVEPAGLAKAIEASLKRTAVLSESEGAWTALRNMPPLLINSHAGDNGDFYRLLVPPLERFGLQRTDKSNFWDWQRDQARYLQQRLVPARDSARQEWTERCVADPAWRTAVEEIALAYRDFVSLEAAEHRSWGIAHQSRVYEARGGTPDCGHITTIKACHLCDQVSLSAHEAHYGWTRRSAWKPRRDYYATEAVNELDKCACCIADHDRRPLEAAACRYCGEAVFWLTIEHHARRWGGWLWLKQELRAWATHYSREWYPEVVNLEQKAGRQARPSPWDEETQKLTKRLGLDPWSSYDPYFERFENVGAFFIPVTIKQTDLKTDIRDRLTHILDALWMRLEIANPKSRAESSSRSINWDRYAQWLWRNRIEGEEPWEIEAPSPRAVETQVSVDPTTVRRGINKALIALSSL